MPGHLFEEFTKNLEEAKKDTEKAAKTLAAAMPREGSERSACVPFWTSPTSNLIRIIETGMEKYPIAIVLNIDKSEVKKIEQLFYASTNLAKALHDMPSIDGFHHDTAPVIYISSEGESYWGLNALLRQRDGGQEADISQAVERIEPLFGIAYDKPDPNENYDQEQENVAKLLKDGNSRNVAGRNGKKIRADNRPLKDSDPEEPKEAFVAPPKVYKDKNVSESVGRVLGPAPVRGRYRVRLYYVNKSGEDFEETAELDAQDPEFIYDMAKTTQIPLPLWLSDEKFQGDVRRGSMRLDTARFYSEGELVLDYLQAIADSRLFPGLDVEQIGELLEKIFPDQFG